MLLKIQGVVRLARDVEIRYSQSGSAIANFSVVSSSKYKTQAGEQKEDTCFIDVTAFGRLGEICNQYLRKGSQIKIDGELKLEQWTAQDGTKRSKHSVTIKEMEMLGSKDDSVQPQPNNDDPTRHNIAGDMNKPARHQQPAPSRVPDINIDEIPF